MHTQHHLLPDLLPEHKNGTPLMCEIPLCDAGTPEPTRTADLRFRKPSLYPLSYGGIFLNYSRSIH
jgi:hypothetical protein